MKRFVPYALGGLLALWLATLGTPARAQEMHTVIIRDGQVQVDGKVLAPARLPEGLDLDGVQAHLTFSGTSRALLEINGALYEVGPEGMVKVSGAGEGDGRVSVFFRSFESEHLPGDSLLYVAPRVRNGVDVHQGALAERALRRAQIEAEVARVAEAQPRLEMRRYLEDVRDHNVKLFERLMREQQMELETRSLAARIQRLPEGEEREALVERLRAQLDEIFELKQENRRNELAQLEAQLEALRKQIDERERLRERIVEQRLKELLGQPSPFDW